MEAILCLKTVKNVTSEKLFFTEKLPKSIFCKSM